MHLSGPVLCLAISSTGEHCYSGGLDGIVNCWNVPQANVDPYDPYEPDVLASTMHGHSDAVWGVTVATGGGTTGQRVASCSADGTVKVWTPHGKVSAR